MSNAHGDKLIALLENEALPARDISRVNEALGKYREWRANLATIAGGPNDPLVCNKMVHLLNEYRTYIDLDLIFDSEDDFLYRQKGQLKLDNTILEEFLPILAQAALKDFNMAGLKFGPSTCYSGMRFETSIQNPSNRPLMKIREKDQDFAITRELHIRSSHESDFSVADSYSTKIAYVAGECKTNLDKTMFQEAAATALDVKTAVPSARYFLICDWLDMTPISTSTTAIDEILILRGKRLSSNVRKDFNTSQKRRQLRQMYSDFLHSNPYRVHLFQRLIDHIIQLVRDNDENEVLARGYF